MKTVFYAAALTILAGGIAHAQREGEPSASMPQDLWITTTTNMDSTLVGLFSFFAPHTLAGSDGVLSTCAWQPIYHASRMEDFRVVCLAMLSTGGVRKTVWRIVGPTPAAASAVRYTGSSKTETSDAQGNVTASTVGTVELKLVALAASDDFPALPSK